MHDFTHDQVRRGRELVAQESKCKWELGDLGLEVAPLAGHGGKRDHDADDRVATRLNRFAGEIGASYESLDLYRHVAARWPIKSRRSDLSFFVHHALARLDDREKVIRSRQRWTVRQAQEHARSARSKPDESWASFDEHWASSSIECCPLCWTPWVGEAA
jgi:hypothetical protein